MCGLVGFYAPTTTTDSNIQLFKNLLLVDQIRGMHATGVAKVDVRKNVVAIHKRAQDAIDFLASEDTKTFLEKDRGQIYIGHNRYATVGDKAAHENAHPFQEKHITLVHNGGVDPHAFDLLSGIDRKDVVVDSHGVTITIAEHGVKKAVTEKLSGGFALVWYDSEERSLNFIRNQDRPLYMAVLTDGALVWASEKGMLDVFCKRAGARSPSYRMEPTLIAHSEHVKFKFNEYGNRIGQGPVVTPMEFLEVAFPKSEGGWWETYYGTSRQSTSQQVVQSSRNGNVVDLDKKKREEAANVRNAERVNGILAARGLPLKWQQVLSCDIEQVIPYEYNEKHGRYIAKDRVSGAIVDIWGIDLDKAPGIKTVRCVLDNAYYTGPGSSLVISCKSAAISVHDPLFSKQYAPFYLSTYPTREEEAEMRIAKQNWDKVHGVKQQDIYVPPAAHTTVPRTTVTFPLKVHGHTFMSRDELVDFTSQGCDTCGKIPSAYHRSNLNMVVRPGPKFTGLLEECNFTCGDCAEL